jgi:hypothetical protein
MNFMAKAALGTAAQVDLEAVRGVWGGTLTDEEVQVVLVGNKNENDTLEAKNMDEPTSDSTALSDNEFFVVFQQKLIDGTITDCDTKEYARRFGKKDQDAKLKILKAVREVWDVSLTGNDVKEQSASTLPIDSVSTISDTSKDMPVKQVKEEKKNTPNKTKQAKRSAARKNRPAAPAPEDIKNTFPKIESAKISNASENKPAQSALPDTKEILAKPAERTTDLSDNEYFRTFQQKVIDECVKESDFKEYVRRFGKDPEATRSNLKLFTMQYRNNFISGIKFAELNFMANAALGTVTALDIKAVRGAWGGGLTLTDVQAILAQK